MQLKDRHSNGIQWGNTSTGNTDMDHSKVKDNFCEETPRSKDAVQFDEIQTKGGAVQ